MCPPPCEGLCYLILEGTMWKSFFPSCTADVWVIYVSHIGAWMNGLRVFQGFLLVWPQLTRIRQDLSFLPWTKQAKTFIVAQKYKWIIRGEPKATSWTFGSIFVPTLTYVNQWHKMQACQDRGWRVRHPNIQEQHSNRNRKRIMTK